MEESELDLRGRLVVLRATLKGEVPADADRHAISVSKEGRPLQGNCVSARIADVEVRPSRTTPLGRSLFPDRRVQDPTARRGRAARRAA